MPKTWCDPKDRDQARGVILKTEIGHGLSSAIKLTH